MLQFEVKIFHPVGEKLEARGVYELPSMAKLKLEFKCSHLWHSVLPIPHIPLATGRSNEDMSQEHFPSVWWMVQSEENEK